MVMYADSVSLKMTGIEFSDLEWKPEPRSVVRSTGPVFFEATFTIERREWNRIKRALGPLRVPLGRLNGWRAYAVSPPRSREARKTARLITRAFLGRMVRR